MLRHIALAVAVEAFDYSLRIAIKREQATNICG
jgi:hypothetical protein